MPCDGRMDGRMPHFPLPPAHANDGRITHSPPSPLRASDDTQDPLNFGKGKSAEQMKDLELKEIKNGRLAMIAIMGK